MRRIIIKKNLIIIFISIAFLFSNGAIAFSAKGDDIKMILKELNQIKQRVKELEKKVSVQEKTILLQRNVIEKVVDASPEMKKALLPPEQKVLVKNFHLKGVHLFSAKDFEATLRKYRNKNLGLSDLKKAADEVTTFYRSKGYTTSLAYAPAQKIANGAVEFRVIESRLGKIKVEDGKYYSKETIKRKITIEEGQILDYAKLEKDIKRINKQPDREVKALLVSGKEPSTSDILLKFEKEENPIHWHIGYNNQGTENTGKDRFDLGFNNNNLFGVDDILSLTLRVGADYDSVYAGSIDYNLPISRYDTRLGVYALHSRADIGRSFEILTPEGKANLWGIYLRHPLFDENLLEPNTINVSSTVSIGFDSINTQNKILDQETSHDELRIVKAGISFDEKDTMGRTFITNEIRFGLSDILGAEGRYDESDSRLDTGTEFFKYVGSLSRITRLPLSSHLVVSMRGQYTNDQLSNSEQLSLGGAGTVRGFPENEYLADYGWSSTLELRTPAFLFPQGIKVPYDKKKTSLKEALQFVYFVDFGQGYLLRTSVGEVSNRSLIGAGFGLRFDFADHLRGRLDWGFPISKEQPSDNSSSQVHFGFEYEF